MSVQKKIYHFINDVSPPLFLPSVLKVASYCRYSTQKKFQEYVSRNNCLENIAKDKDAFVLATGPSLKGVDLSPLKNVDVFSVSNFFLHEQLSIVSPRMHFFMPYHKPLVFEEYIDWLKMSDEILPISTDVVLGCQTKKDVDDFNLFKERDVYYLMLEKSQITHTPNITRTILSPQTSPLMILPVLYYMGYKRIFLMGCDHNHMKYYGGTVDNFYDREKDVRSNATSGNNWVGGVCFQLESLANVFKQYEFYNNIFNANDVQLYNMSSDSWLDFIPYYSLDDYVDNYLK